MLVAVVVVVVVVVVVGTVLAVDDVGAVEVEVEVVVGAVVGALVTVVVAPPPPSAAITASATIRPITAAASRTIAHLAPRLMPPAGGGPDPRGGSGWPM